MSPRSWQERAQDILDAIVEIRAFAGDMDVAALAIDAKTLKAIQLNFIVIGEAANHIPDDVQTRHPQVPWHLVRGMRNRLVHAYFTSTRRSFGTRSTTT